MVTLMFVFGIVFYLVLNFINSFNQKNSSNSNTPLVLSFVLIFGFTNAFAQSDIVVPKRMLSVDVLGLSSKENREFTLYYEKSINQKKSFIGTLGFLGKEKSEIAEGTFQSEYVKTDYDGYAWIFIIPISTEGTYYEGGEPLSEIDQTVFNNYTLYARAGNVFYSNPYSRRGNVFRLFSKTEGMMGFQSIEKYTVADSQVILDSETSSYSDGVIFFFGESGTDVKTHIKETREVTKETTGNLLLGLLGSVGVQAVFDNRLAFNLEYNVGFIVSKESKVARIGRGTNQKNIYNRLSLTLGVAF